MPRQRLILPCALLAVALAVPRPARALDEGDWQVAVTPSLVINTDRSRIFSTMGGARLEGRRGLSEMVSVWGALGFAFTVVQGTVYRASTASAGMTLAFDVAGVVPFVEGGVVLADWAPHTSAHRRLGVELGFGVEYLIDPAWSIAAVIRAQSYPLRLQGPPDDGSVDLSLGMRVGRTF